MTCREIQNRTFREEVKISFNSQRPICGQMSGLAGAGNKTRNYQQQKQLQSQTLHLIQNLYLKKIYGDNFPDFLNKKSSVFNSLIQREFSFIG